jgi:hypothetical protein
MTAQATEILLFEGEELSLCNEPLVYFLDNQQPPVKFMSPHTALWRGYIGTWSIEGERLYLKSIKATIIDEVSGGFQEAGLDAVFPGFPDGVFAHWFSGELRCARGALLKYVHGGFGSVYERDLFFKVKKGVVIDRREVVNGVAPEGVHESDDI